MHFRQKRSSLESLYADHPHPTQGVPRGIGGQLKRWEFGWKKGCRMICHPRAGEGEHPVIPLLSQLPWDWPFHIGISHRYWLPVWRFVGDSGRCSFVPDGCTLFHFRLLVPFISKLVECSVFCRFLHEVFNNVFCDKMQINTRAFDAHF